MWYDNTKCKYLRIEDNYCALFRGHHAECGGRCYVLRYMKENSRLAARIRDEARRRDGRDSC